MSLSRTFSSASSDNDYKDDCFYLIRKSHGDYRDEPFCYDGISDGELHHHLNIEFERSLRKRVIGKDMILVFARKTLILLQRNISNLNHRVCSTQ